MQIETIIRNDRSIATVHSNTCILTDTASALDLMMSIKYETGCERIILNKDAVTEDFFILSTRLAGEILQKFINYGVKFSVYGDFTGYTSKPLKDFMYESNHGHDFFFASDLNEALDMISVA